MKKEKKAKKDLPIINKEIKKELETYNPEDIDKKPNTEEDLLKLYGKYSLTMHSFVKTITEDSPVVLTNEVRALFGHLSAYRTNSIADRGELSGAYGHFRRYNLDILKILCDELDKSSMIWLKGHYHYNYKKVKNDFLSGFVNRYLLAQNLYLRAQLNEKVGSDTGHHNIFKEYHDAVKGYIDLCDYLAQYRKDIESARRKGIAKIVVLSAISVVCLIASVISILPF